MTTKTRNLFLVGGVLLFVLLLNRIGWGEIAKDIGLMGWALLIPVALQGVAHALNTLAWLLLIDSEHFTLGFWKRFLLLLKIRIQGEATNSLTPVNFAAGDPLRVYLIQSHLPLSVAGASVMLDRLVSTLALSLFMMAGVSVALLNLPLPPFLAITLASLTLLLNGAVFFLFAQKRHGFFQLAARIAHTLHLKRDFLRRNEEKIHQLDEAVYSCHRERRGALRLAVLVQLLGRCAGMVEIYVIAQILGIALGWNGSFFLMSVIPLINMIFSFIPGAIGALEGSTGAIFLWIGLQPMDGVTLQIIRRLRTAIWIGIGLLLFIWDQKHKHLKAVEKGAA